MIIPGCENSSMSAKPVPKSYTRTKNPPAPTLSPLEPNVDQVLQADSRAPRKKGPISAQMLKRAQRALLRLRIGQDSSRCRLAPMGRQETLVRLVVDAPGLRLLS